MHKIHILFYPAMLWFLNYIAVFVPCLFFRKLMLRLFSAKIGRASLIDMNCYFLSPNKLSIGNHTQINRGCMIDSRGGIIIGNNVSLSHRVTLCSASHNIKSPNFDYVAQSIVIHDNVWVGLNAIILQGVTIGEGAVVAAGSVVTHDIELFSIYAGIPAKKIGSRDREINYDVTNFAYYKGIRIPYFQ